MLLIALVVVAVFLPAALTAQAGDTLASREVARGVHYAHFLDRTGPWTVHVVRVNLREPGISLRHARAHDALQGRERTSAMARRLGARESAVLAAINADFFWLTTGENENNQVIDGEWWKGVKVTDSPYDTFDNTHVQFSLSADGRPSMERFAFEGVAIGRGGAMPILALNFNPPGRPEGTALYTARYGDRTPRDTTRVTAEIPIAAIGHSGDTLLFVRVGAVSSSSGSSIPMNGAVLSAYGAGARLDAVRAMAHGDTIRVLLAATAPSGVEARPSLLIGGWPRILRNGVNVAPDAATTEGTISRNAEVRHPRSAIGFSRDSTHLLLVTVDGRQATSVGATLVELAGLMLRLGAWDAMNFDGGGSTTMVVDGKVVNRPSDATGEREVGNALVVVKRSQAQGFPSSPPRR